MKVKIFKKSEGVERKISDSYSVSNLLTGEHSDKVSVAVSTANDHHEITKSVSDRAYYVLEGEITVNDQLVCKQGDVVFIPANTEYKFEGTFKAVLINSPPFKNSEETTKNM
ncbi:hypothetical protein ACFL0V_02810 [Nanoarchaeota archaeon]